jgi:cobalamin synthase
MAGWFWLIFIVSFCAWLILLNVPACTHEEFGGIRCYPDTWYGNVLEISNFWLAATLLIIVSAGTLLRNPFDAMFLAPMVVLLFGTAILMLRLVRRSIGLVRRRT